MSQPGGEEPRLLTPLDVARLYRVAQSTVRRWAREGRIPSVRTPVGHLRFPEPEVRAQLEQTHS